MSDTHIGIVGDGASTVYMLYHMLQDVEQNGAVPGLKLTIFEKDEEAGVGMPYSAKNVRRMHVVNILPEETPPLLQTMEEWLKSLNDAELAELGIHDRADINDRMIYSRIIMGKYLQGQETMIKKKLEEHGVHVETRINTHVADIVDNPATDNLQIKQANGEVETVDRVVIATGHFWPEHDKPEEGYFLSPWPISKLPIESANHPVGLLGSSLSSYDVAVALAEQHGKFEQRDGKLAYVPNPGTEQFSLAMHSGQGKLPHIRCGFESPYQKHYASREQMRAFIEQNGGVLPLDVYFSEVCRPSLVRALKRDGLDHLADTLETGQCNFSDFIKLMAESREYENPFDGMRWELVESRRSIEYQAPIHWKEVLDDLIYTLNFYAEHLPAEDHMCLRRDIMPFFMNMVAFLPPQSAEKLLALYDAGKVSLVGGRVGAVEPASEGSTVHYTDLSGRQRTADYKLFVDCSGQKLVTLENFPFPSLVENKKVRMAATCFTNPATKDKVPEKMVIERDGEPQYLIGGIDVNENMNMVGTDGEMNKRIYDIAASHIMGIRPFPSGLVYCHDISKIATTSIMAEARQRSLGEGLVPVVSVQSPGTSERAAGQGRALDRIIAAQVPVSEPNPNIVLN